MDSGRGHPGRVRRWVVWTRIAGLGSALLFYSVTGIAWGQALSVTGSVDLSIEVTVDREGCAQPECVRLEITVRNLGATERFVTRDLVDVSRVRLESEGRQFRLNGAAGEPHADIRERLDPAGGAHDRLVRHHTLPGCCTIVLDGARLEKLPPGRYVARYEGALPDAGDADGQGRGVLQSAPAWFTIDGPHP